LGIFGEDSIFEEVAKNLKSSIRKVKFENGLTLLMMKRTNSPTLALYTKFKVGSADETPEIAGTAHLLEHMLFKGTTNVGTTNYAKEKKYYLLLKVTGNELDSLKLEIRNLEERGYPIPIELKERKEILKAIRYVDDIIVYQVEDTFLSYLCGYNIRFLGDDYINGSYTGKDNPINIVFVDRSHDYSTTELKRKIAKSLK
jgi:hypothetical protein